MTFRSFILHFPTRKRHLQQIYYGCRKKVLKSFGGNALSNSIGLGEYRVGHPGMDEWTMHGLGSCIGLIIACRKTYISAAAHIVLPMNPSAQEQNSGQPARYGREAVPFLINEKKEKRST